jgi:hypothetical protein
MSDQDEGSTGIWQLTLAEVVGRLFPEGTQIFHSQKAVLRGWPAAPDFPPDLFAVAGTMLEIAGAYQYGAFPDPKTGLWGPSVFRLTVDEHQNCIKAGRDWSRSPFETPKLAKQLWKELGGYAGEPVFTEHRVNLAPVPWWRVAMKLLIIADESCNDVGFGYSRELSDAKPTWISDIPQYFTEDTLRELAKKTTSGHIAYYPQLPSICLRADFDVVCVQPKSRTPTVGCTLRTFSHNLALLPPRGLVKGSWQRPPEILKHDDESALNLLLVPFPYSVRADAFLREPCSVPEGVDPWGWFGIHQEWLLGHHGDPAKAKKKNSRQRREALVRFVSQLIVEAKRDVGTLHGIVFPEYALDWDSYDSLVMMIRKDFPEIEFLVAGSSNNCRGESGNVALSTVFTRPENRVSKRSIAITTSRAKHHRWRLNEAQISSYALASALDPRMIWWEKTLLPKREIHVNVFRSGSTFATMICEDLARVDPAHAILRSVAPSLVFVLLMDGPQRADRWSARYATVLAEDPGSSVLTLTSTALLERANREGRYGKSRSVALWKQDNGGAVPIELPIDHHAIVLTLSGYRTTETTLDGRPNRDGRAWRFHGQQPIRFVPRNKSQERDRVLIAGAD